MFDKNVPLEFPTTETKVEEVGDLEQPLQLEHGGGAGPQAPVPEPVGARAEAGQESADGAADGAAVADLLQLDEVSGVDANAIVAADSWFVCLPFAAGSQTGPRDHGTAG